MFIIFIHFVIKVASKSKGVNMVLSNSLLDAIEHRHLNNDFSETEIGNSLDKEESERESPLVSILTEDRYNLFKTICSHLKPLDMQAFLSTCKTFQWTCEILKEDNETIYKALMTRIFANSFGEKSVEEISNDIINFCKNGDFSQFKELLQSLKICNKFHEVSVKTLEEAFLYSCMYTYAKIVQLFIKSGRFHEISLDSLNRSFGLCSPRDDGTTIQMLINSDRFHEISQKSLGDALKHATINGHPGVVKAIINSTRACEISINDLEEALKYAAGNGYLNKNNHLESLRYLINSPRYQELSADGLGEALRSACSNWRGDAVQELGKSVRFHEISQEYLNKSFYWSLRNFNLFSAKFFIESARFNEISLENLKEAYNLALSEPELMEVLRQSGRTI